MWCCRGKRQSTSLVEDVEVMVYKRMSKKRKLEVDSEVSETSEESSSYEA